VFTRLTTLAAVLACACAAPVMYWRLGRSPTAPVWAVESMPGSVVLAGGTFIDPMGEEVVRLGGGDQARVVLIPTAYGPTEEEGVEQFREQWSRYGPATIDILHTRDRAKANDPAFVAPLREATAVWFFGGVQERLLDTYEDTLLHRELLGVLKRGGVVGGNCAGAMALGETMIVRNEDEEDDVLLRRGFGIVPKMVNDSHWLERNRIERLRGVIEEHPDHFGVGIDSQTAVIIHQGKLRVMGNSYAATVVPVAGENDVRFDIWDGGDEVPLAELFAAGRGH
jgi:cyanophycinase